MQISHSPLGTARFSDAEGYLRWYRGLTADETEKLTQSWKTRYYASFPNEKPAAKQEEKACPAFFSALTAYFSVSNFNTFFFDAGKTKEDYWAAGRDKHAGEIERFILYSEDFGQRFHADSFQSDNAVLLTEAYPV